MIMVSEPIPYLPTIQIVTKESTKPFAKTQEVAYLRINQPTTGII